MVRDFAHPKDVSHDFGTCTNHQSHSKDRCGPYDSGRQNPVGLFAASLDTPPSQMGGEWGNSVGTLSSAAYSLANAFQIRICPVDGHRLPKACALTTHAKQPLIHMSALAFWSACRPAEAGLLVGRLPQTGEPVMYDVTVPIRSPLFKKK